LKGLEIVNECVPQEGIYEMVDSKLQQKVLRVLNVEIDQVKFIDSHVFILTSILTQKLTTRIGTKIINVVLNDIMRNTLWD
jgi:hypothetical protein